MGKRQPQRPLRNFYYTTPKNKEKEKEMSLKHDIQNLKDKFNNLVIFCKVFEAECFIFKLSIVFSIVIALKVLL